MRLSDDGLRAALRSEAAAHQPDREAMLDRISTAAMQDSGRRRAPRRGPRARMATVVAAVVVLFGGGGIGTWALANSIDRDEATPAPTVTRTTAEPTPVDTAPETTKPAPSRTTPSRKPSPAAPPPAPTRERPGDAQGPLWSDGSIDPSGASVVTLKTTAELRTLEVVIRVARTDGLTSRGGTKSTPGASVTTTVTEEPGAFLYRFTLASADTLAPGTYTFTAKYASPSGGRDAGGDTYEATSGALKVNGDFF